MGKSIRKLDEEGLPILVSHSDTTVLDNEGLPVPVKKKEPGGSVSPLGTSPNQEKTEPSVNISGSESSNKALSLNYKGNSLTPKDVSSVGDGSYDPTDWAAKNAGIAAESINNKGKNLEQSLTAPAKEDLSSTVKKQQQVKSELYNIEADPRRAKMLYGEGLDSKVKNLKDQESFLSSSIQKLYDVQKGKVIPDVIDNLKGYFAADNWLQIYDNVQVDDHGMSSPIAIVNPLKWDPETHKLTPKSAEWVLKNVDDFLNKKGDDVINAKVSGDLDKKERTYADMGKSVIDFLNTIPVKKAQEKFTEEYAQKNPHIKSILGANHKNGIYFSKENVETVKAKINTQRDKDFINTQQKYYGEGGIFQGNQDFVGIQHRYAQLVADKKMTDDVARKQIQAEIKQHPALKRINDNFENEIKKINERTQKQYETFIIQGLKKDNPNLTVYKDGSVGVEGLSKDQYANMMEGYEEGMNKVAVKMVGEQEAAVIKQNNEKAKRYGAFLGSLNESGNDLISGFSKFIFNKTQWGGDNVRFFESREAAGPNISQSKEADSWNWKGLESLKDPNFWLSKTGAMVPVIAGAAAITATTQGEGIPAYVSWLANAGLFTAQNGLSTYGQLLNSKDAQGNLLTEADASYFMATDMEKSILPNVLMMAATSGTLLRAKNIVKPTILGSISKGIKGAATAQPFFTWQGYESYANMKEAIGEKTDMWDYMQSKDFKDNLINGMIIGSGLSLLHTPGTHMKSLDNWTKMVHTASEGEFRNLIPENYALQQEMAGRGNYLRDALKLNIYNVDPEGLSEGGKRQLVDFKNQLLYSVNLDRNIKSANLDPAKINDLYQAHNLALADQQDFLAEQSKDNKSLSSLYSDKAKEYREQAKSVSNEEGKFHYLTNDEGQPIFMSDKAFKALDKDGTIAKWITDGTVDGIHSSDDPEFGQRYKEHLEAKNESSVEGKSFKDHASDLIEENKNKLGTTYAVAKENPELFYKEVADQVFGRNADGSTSLRPDAEIETRTQYGDDIVDVAKIMYPSEEKAAEPKADEKTTEVKSSYKEDYKPNIRDDYFAKKEFFTTEEKEAFYKLDDAGKDKMIDDKRAELKAQAEEDKITVSEMIDKPGLYKGKRGTFSQDGQSVVFKVDGSNREYELGNINEIGGESLKDFGIEQESSVVGANEENNMTVRGKEYVNRYIDPFAAINYDENGNVVSVNLETPDGNKRAFRGNIAEDLAYQIHLKEISKNNEQASLEEFINSDEPTRKEIEDGGLEEAAEVKSTGDTEKVQRTPIVKKPKVEDSSPKNKEDGKTEKTNEAERRQGDVLTPEESADKKEGSAPPLPPEPPPRVVSETPKEEFTSVRKEKNREVAGAKALFEKQQQIKWTETYDNALSNVQAMYPDKGLYDAMKSRIGEFTTMLDNKRLFNPTSEDIAVFNVFKDETKRRMNEIAGWDSPDDVRRMAASVEFAALSRDLFDVVRVTNPGGEAGRAFNLLQSEIANDPEHGLQIRRMELLGAKGGGKLTEADLSLTADLWEKEKAIFLKEQALKEKALLEKIEKSIGSVAKEKPAKDPATKKEKQDKLLSEKGKDLADKIRSGKLKGTYATFPGVPQAINVVLEGIAKLVEGGFTLAQAIDEFVKANGLKNRDQFQKDLFEVFNKQEKQEEAYAKIYNEVESGSVNDITNYMVSKNIIRDYVNSFVGLHDKTDILKMATEGLKKILPSVDENRLREAYLKEGEFKQPTKKQLESGFKESERAFNRLSKVEKDIKDLENKRDLFKRGTKKSETPFDKDIEAKENEKKLVMDSMGVKTSGEDKYTKASYDQRAASHNDRLDALGKSIDEKLNKGDLPDAAKSALIKLKGQLEGSKIKLDNTSALSQEKTMDGGLSIIKGIKSEFTRATIGDISKMGEINRELQKVIDKFGSEKEDSQQDIKLQRAKDKAKKDRDEFARKLINNEFEEKEPVELTKTDAELLKLERDKGAVRQLYENKKKEYEKKNATWRKRVGEFLRAAEVAYLLKSLFTLLKVGASALLRPALEATTKLTFGKGFEKLPFDTTKIISEQAKLGGEGSSIKSIKKGYEAYFRQYSPEQLEKKYAVANDKYEKSSKDYHEFTGDLQKIKDDKGVDSKEYKEALSKSEELKNKMNDNLVDAVSNSVYQFIAGSSLREAMEVLLHRSALLEMQFGDFDREGWQKFKESDSGKEKISTALENLSYLMNFTGRSHAALKNFSSRYSFASSFMSRLEANVKNGVDISKPDKILEIAHESYFDWERGKYQESNWVSDTWNKVTNAVERVSPEMAYLLKADIAITRVPVNMLREGIMEYSLGAIRGSVMAAREYYKAKGIVLQDGYTPENEAQFKSELEDQLKKIDPDRAATIVRAFRKGGFGLGMYALALTGYAAFGGFAHLGQTAEKKKKEKRDAELGIEEIKTSELKLGDWKVPEWSAKVIEHTPAFQPMLFAAGLGQVYENNIIDGTSTPEAVKNSIFAHVEHIVNSIPQAEVIVALGSGILKKVEPSGQWDDVDVDGNPMKRKAFEASDYFNYLPGYGDKKEALSENYYKQAVSAKKSARQEITEIMLNTSKPQKEKEEERKQILKDLHERIEDIYKQNKENPQ